MPGWIIATFAAMAALVPAGIYFTISFMGYTYSGYGTGSALAAAPGPLLGAGIIPALLTISAGYYVVRRSRRGSSEQPLA